MIARHRDEYVTLGLAVFAALGVAVAMLLLETSCGAPPMGAADPTSNGNLAAQEACVAIDAGLTISATKAAIDACRCAARVAHGEACEGGAP